MESPFVRDKLILLLLFEGFLLTSCTLIENRQTNSTLPNTPSLEESSASPPFQIEFRQHCLNIETNTPSHIDSQARLLISDDIYGDHPYFLSLPSLVRQPFLDHLNDWHISPNGKWIAIDINGQLVITDSKGAIQKTLTWRAEWGDILIGWLDNNRIAINGYNPLGSIIVINPSTDREQVITAMFSDFVDDTGINLGIGLPFAVYDSTLTRVLYVSPGPNLVLRDATSGKVIWGKRGRSSIPAWSPDGKQAMFVQEKSASDFTLIDRDGQANQINFLNTAYDSPISAAIRSYTWSANGQHIALGVFLQQTKNDQPEEIDGHVAYHLVVNSLADKQMTDYCIPFIHSPRWSPDSRYLAVDHIIIDLENERAYKVTDGYIIGWLADEQ
jgi:hypothetical protein